MGYICGVHNLHGMPGILGGIISAIAIWSAGSDNKPKETYYNGAGCGKDGDCHFYYDWGRQGGQQIAALGGTLGIAIAGGLAVGAIIKKIDEFNEFYVKSWYHDNNNFVGPVVFDGLGDNTSLWLDDEVYCDTNVYCLENNCTQYNLDRNNSYCNSETSCAATCQCVICSPSFYVYITFYLGGLADDTDTSLLTTLANVMDGFYANLFDIDTSYIWTRISDNGTVLVSTKSGRSIGVRLECYSLVTVQYLLILQ